MSLQQRQSYDLFQVGKNCPYYDDGYTEALLTAEGDTIEIEGPFHEIYVKQTPPAPTEQSPTTTSDASGTISPVPDVEEMERGRDL